MTVLVTGGCGRIGSAISARLKSDGWTVARSSSRPDAGAELVADLGQPGAADALFADATNYFGAPPDALVNNAAVFNAPDRQIQAVNLDAPVRLSLLLAEASGVAGSRAVVNILDCVVMREDFIPATMYEKTKAGILRWTKEAAGSFLPALRVNGVAPGAVFPPPGGGVKAGPSPFGRPSAAAVAAAVAFLLKARFTSGCVIPVDGGQSVFSARRLSDVKSQGEIKR